MDDVRQRMLAYMQAHITMTIATASKNVPHAATVFYANDGFDLYYVSDSDTVHGRDALANPCVFVTISQDYEDWQRIQGIQLRGRAQLLDTGYERAAEVYAAKFPFVASFPPEALTYWKISTEWVRMVDNTVAFAHKDEIDLVRVKPHQRRTGAARRARNVTSR
jgi:uncharacterized protein YhbP (UPF0306 family)